MSSETRKCQEAVHSLVGAWVLEGVGLVLVHLPGLASGGWGIVHTVEQDLALLLQHLNQCKRHSNQCIILW